MELSRSELERYARQLILPEIGEEGQKKLKAARVLVIGAGGLGSPALYYLAAAGVGHITIVESDRVEPSNLNRQILYTAADVGRMKAEVARERLLALNPDIEVEALARRFDVPLARKLVPRHDLVVDASDNFATRYLANDAAVLFDRPLVHGSIYRFEGQLAVFHHEGGPCYRCLYPAPPKERPSCGEVGVLGALPGVVGAMMAAEAVKVILGIGEPLSRALLLVDLFLAEFRKLKVKRNPACPVCGERPVITELLPSRYEDDCRG